VVDRFGDWVAIIYLGRIVELRPIRKIFSSPRYSYRRALLVAVPRLVPEPGRAA
jgi:peptide/nickel transport system ATP-binding protein